MSKPIADTMKGCLKCGHPSAHYVPPSFGDAGFYACESFCDECRPAPAPSPAEQNDETEREALAQIVADILDSIHDDDFGPLTPSDYAVADAILAAGYSRSSPAATTREWEYGTVYEMSSSEVVYDAWPSRKAAQKWVDESPTDTGLVRRTRGRRTPAGPWLPVPKEGE